MRLLDFIRTNALFLMAGFLLAFGSSFGQTFVISVFAGEIRAEFGLSHGAWGGIYALGTLASAVAMVWVGGLTDRFRIRQLGLSVIVLLALSCLLMASVSAVWMLVLAIFALRLCGQGMMSHMTGVSMARWFAANRGRALSIASLGFAVGEATLPILMVALMTVIDWRMLWVGSALVVMMMLPVLARLLRLERTPQSVAEEDQSFGMSARHWTRGQVLRHPLFWLLIPALLGPGAFNTAFFFQQVHFAEIKGWTHLQLVALFPIYTVTSITAMFASGFLIDRFGTWRMMPFYQLPMALGFFLLSVATTPIGVGFGLICLAVTGGSNATLSTAFWAEFYGTRFLGSIKAMGAAVMVLGSAIGPGITGVLISAGIGLEYQMVWIAGYFVLTCLSVWIGVSRARSDLPATA